MASGAYSSTTVTVEKSQGEIRSLLSKHGAERFSFMEGEANGRWWVGLEFVHHDHLVRIAAPLKEPDEQAIRGKVRRARTKRREDFVREHNEQEGRRIWRVIYWSLKSRLEAVEEELETFEQAFLSHLVDPGTNQTLWDGIRPHVESGRLQIGARGLPMLERSTG